MKHQNENSNADKKSATQILATAILPVIFALTITACSLGNKPAETKTSETNKASANNSAANPTSAGSTDSSSTSGDLAGTYTVSGAGADGKTYQGDLLVTKRDAVYQLSWKLGAENYDGVAVQSGNTWRRLTRPEQTAKAAARLSIKSMRTIRSKENGANGA